MVNDQSGMITRSGRQDSNLLEAEAVVVSVADIRQLGPDGGCAPMTALEHQGQTPNPPQRVLANPTTRSQPLGAGDRGELLVVEAGDPE